jgi:hypothetical protein
MRPIAHVDHSVILAKAPGLAICGNGLRVFGDDITVTDLDKVDISEYDICWECQSLVSV